MKRHLSAVEGIIAAVLIFGIASGIGIWADRIRPAADSPRMGWIETSAADEKTLPAYDTETLAAYVDGDVVRYELVKRMQGAGINGDPLDLWLRTTAQDAGMYGDSSPDLAAPVACFIFPPFEVRD